MLVYGMSTCYSLTRGTLGGEYNDLRGFHWILLISTDINVTCGYCIELKVKLGDLCCGLHY